MFQVFSKIAKLSLLPFLSVCLMVTMGNLQAQELEKRVIGKPGNYGMAGCGLGSMVAGPKRAQLFAATTNGTASNQVWGISFGTSNCDAEVSQAFLQKEQENFVSVNYSSLQQEMAIGKGKKLEAFVSLLGCSDSIAFSAMAQKNHSYFFAVPKEQASKFVSRIQAKIKTENHIAVGCNVKA